MKNLEIPLIRGYGNTMEMKVALELLEAQATLNDIDTVNWKEFPVKPRVRFRIGYLDGAILLKYYVTERHVRARVTEINGPVHRDSCVEFFFSPGTGYYNLEFNCAGIVHAAWGTGRQDRMNIDPAILATMGIFALPGSEPAAEKNGEPGREAHSWELGLFIPAGIFVHDRIDSLSGRRCRGNFYKCGDDTPEPHYLSWSPVLTERPDFHRSEFFGDLFFE